MRHLLVVAAVALVPACSQGSEPLTVLVDYDHDEFATQFYEYFPETVAAHPGDVVRFRQAWTGEPHTVTFGVDVGPALEVTRPLLAQFGDRPESEVPPEVIEEYIEAEMTVPHVWRQEDDQLNQSVAQPCVVAEGQEIGELLEPCPQQELPAFEGTETFYNSGIIPYEGTSGNVFELELSDDIAPGTYPFICAVHGSSHSGVLEVVPEDQPVPDQREFAVRTRQVIDGEIAPLAETFQQAVAEGTYARNGEVHEGNFAGLVRGEFDGVVNEFIPKRIDVAVDEPVTWLFFGPHSVSFDVPEYFPILEWDEDGTVTFNDDVEEPAGGAPTPPEPEEGDEGPLVVDGGTYDGDGFWSSGVLWSSDHVEYTLRFSQPGTYAYACLIHPPMVGTVRVRP